MSSYINKQHLAEGLIIMKNSHLVNPKRYTSLCGLKIQDYFSFMFILSTLISLTRAARTGARALKDPQTTMNFDLIFATASAVFPSSTFDSIFKRDAASRKSFGSAVRDSFSLLVKITSSTFNLLVEKSALRQPSTSLLDDMAMTKLNCVPSGKDDCSSPFSRAIASGLCAASSTTVYSSVSKRSKRPAGRTPDISNFSMPHFRSASAAMAEFSSSTDDI
mmetsp:Transcript_16887/g.28994  ORF Transcript_16887/g.28994 Transcript_16887/m.28994 type:complete len:220 (+) Transcript_16887:160-819(+)